MRNNNPGNIERGNTPWLGLETKQYDNSFCTFTTPQYGIRALALTLLTYQSVHHLWSVGDMIERWAPSGENPTPAYAAFVCERVGVTLNQRIDLKDPTTLTRMVQAIIAFENDNFAYSFTVLNEGIYLALNSVAS